MTEIQTVVTDLDDTLSYEHNITAENRAALDETMKAGIPVIAVTTRMRYSAASILKGTGITSYPGICLNGAHILGPGWEKSDCQVLYSKDLSLDVASAVVRYADEMGYEITTIFKEKKYWKERRDRGAELSPGDPAAVIVKKNTCAVDQTPPVSFMMHSEINGEEGMRDMENFVMENFSKRTIIHRHHRMEKWTTITIYPGGINKGTALHKLSELGIVNLKYTLAIGNDYVDLPMLEAAAVGIAMEDSPEEVRNVADEIAPSCLESGFSWALRRYLL
ncbi:MAG: HAD family hydrolase [Thermoplasmata archaeon]